MIANTAAYHFTPVAEPDALCATLLERASAAQLRGTRAPVVLERCA